MRTRQGSTQNLVLTFSESIAAGSGKIVLNGGGQTIEIPITDFNQVSISGQTLRIDPAVSLLPNTDYTATLASGVIKDLAGNTFAGGTAKVSLSSLATAAAATWTVMIYMAAQDRKDADDHLPRRRARVGDAAGATALGLQPTRSRRGGWAPGSPSGIAGSSPASRRGTEGTTRGTPDAV